MAIAGLAGPAGWSPLSAQMTGLPVLQNAFSNPGITVAANVGAMDGGSALAGAAAWAPGSGRFQLSGGLGVVNPEEGKSLTTYGVRAAVPLPWFRAADGSFGLAGFAGFGGASRSGSSATSLPVGLGIGYRRALGATRALSVYGAPFFLRSTAKPEGGDSESSGLFRASVGLDVAVAPRLGLTLGYELGATAKTGKPGPSGGVFGGGVSFAFR